jgi:hypothetical protein
MAEKYGAIEHGHMKDSDCTLDDNLICTVCGVWHGEPCQECEGKGFHLDTCSEMEHCCDDECRSIGCTERHK